MSDFDIASAVETFVREWLYEMSRDEIGLGLGGIIDCGRKDHHLDEENLAAFVHGVILGLAEGGATPEDDRFVTPDNPFGLAHFGADTPREIADGVVADWIRSGKWLPNWGVWRMNMPQNRAVLAEGAEERTAWIEAQIRKDMKRVDTEADMTAAVRVFVDERLHALRQGCAGSGLGATISAGRCRHGLEGQDLVTFVHGVILGLAEGGATPQDDRFASPDNPFGLAHFGSDTPREVADGIVAEWVASGMPAVDWDAWCMDMAPNRARLAGVMTAWAEFVDRWKRSNPKTRP